MSNSIYQTGTVPTRRYRVLAIVFFLIAAAALFIGALGGLAAKAEGPLSKFFALFIHSDYITAYSDPKVLGGTLFSYLYGMFQMFTANSFAFSKSSPSEWWPSLRSRRS